MADPTPTPKADDLDELVTVENGPFDLAPNYAVKIGGVTAAIHNSLDHCEEKATKIREALRQWLAARAPRTANAEANWIIASVRKPPHMHKVLGWMTGGSMHCGEDWMDTVYWNDKRQAWITSAGIEDVVVEVSHWHELPPEPSAALSATAGETTREDIARRSRAVWYPGDAKAMSGEEIEAMMEQPPPVAPPTTPNPCAISFPHPAHDWCDGKPNAPKFGQRAASEATRKGGGE